jgi:HNH endonuclease
MSAHSSANSRGREICDALSQELTLLRPGVIRHEKVNWCTLHRPPHGRIAYIKHTKTASLTVFLRSDPDLSLACVPHSLPIEKRGRIQAGWALRFPYSIRLSDPERVKDLARFLSDLSYPLALRKAEFTVVAALPPEEAARRTLSDGSSYVPQEGDRRAILQRQIRERRGQQSFRDLLRSRYGDRCLVTGCRLLDVLEAAHIRPYRGETDNHAENGLLLRADIHTLFDLNLLGIEPKTLLVRANSALVSDPHYASFDGKKLGCASDCRPSIDALRARYEEFQNNEQLAHSKRRAGSSQ